MDSKHNAKIKQIDDILKEKGLKGYSAKKIAERIKTKNDLKTAVKAMKYADSLLDDIYTDSERNIFNHRAVVPKTILLWISGTFFEPLKNQFKPYGLNLPFPDYESACKWLEKEANEGVLATARIVPSTYNGVELSVVKEFPYLYRSSQIRLSYKKYRNNKVDLICNNSVFLISLKSAIDTIVTYTGFDEISLLKYFFCNIEPELERITAKKSTEVGYRFIFELHTNDVTREEFLKIYNLYRNEIGRMHRKRLSQEMIDFTLFIQKLDLPLEMHKKDYESLIRAYIEKYPHKRSGWIKNENGEEVLNYRRMWAMHKRYKDKEKEEKIDLGYLNSLVNRREANENGKH